MDNVARGLGIHYGLSISILAGPHVLDGRRRHLSWEVSRREERNRNLAEEMALMRRQEPAPQGDNPDGWGPEFVTSVTADPR